MEPMDYMLGCLVLGADPAGPMLQATTLRETMLYVSPTGSIGAKRGQGITLYVDFGTITNGRRRVNMTPGGTDYWVEAHDVAPAFDVTPKPTPPPEPVPFGPITELEAKAQGWKPSEIKDPFSDLAPRAAVAPTHKPPAAITQRQALIIGGIVLGVFVLGLGTTIYLAAKSKWGWALANFFLFTPIAGGTVGLAGTAIAASSNKETT